MANKSKIYGYYGGVTSENHYVPPPSIPFVPQPASVPFYKSYAFMLSSVALSTSDTQSFLSANDDILLRRYLVSATDTQEFYEIKTNRHPNDLIVYNTGVSGISGTESLSLMDGGYF